MNVKDIYKLYADSYLVDTDTRTIREGSVFFALKGENFNGNRFAQEALKKGARYAIIDEKEYIVNDKTIVVEDVLKTLQELATYHRNRLNITIIALTGSNGKTTTKELINVVLSEKYKVTATKGNLNNHIGVPLTLLSMTPETEIGVVEIGANHQKEIALLSTIANPDYGLITNFGKAHLEGFGSVEGIIKGKSELYDFLKDNSKIAIVNPEDSIQMDKTSKIKRILFDDSIKYNSASPFVSLSYKNQEIKSNLIGNYNYSNICTAITIGAVFEVNLLDIKKAIEKYVPANNRSQVIKKGNLKIVLDAYNANPTSMKCSLESFREMDGIYKTVILGDMFELGGSSGEEHQQIVTLLERSNFDNCYLVGEEFFKTNTSFKKFKEFDDLKTFMIEKPINNGRILIKGSRGMSLERVLDII
ncbi:UDP-N-acetylmuramoyl-tripeptide--D-alanyl-D-alanine ligase [Tenacibaculum sp. MAR_2009_124]|uniref:UDP-N-acetylmuramoyl-tripeptide--D-alanyl-D- alanine ligase n=1 Tax=Tenacibaculum sp. MAR_2009_124 TaxID=1250059 RepID=UPI000898F338|nr:UDP-N-acetylmuramoyl-tripeptide--D-alanyl-D-alanine ligase [Tenacibaculum sp. MAR_2009_124]SEB70260.1 UDP-N-acetylmuramoyl-tripeptide--D-alanyl-D-alanine ligase [Tenacibaculum sp. MAR_2009_124]